MEEDVEVKKKAVDVQEEEEVVGPWQPKCWCCVVSLVAKARGDDLHEVSVGTVLTKAGIKSPP